LVIFTAIAVGWPLPLLPLQILWMNLVTDVFPALALAVEPPSEDIMSQPPRSSHTSLLSKPLLILIGWQAVMLAAIALGVYMWALEVYGPGPHSRTIALFALVSVQLGHMFNCRSRTRSAADGIFRNHFLWLAALVVVLLQILAVYAPPLAAVLGTVNPTATDWIVIAGCGLLPIGIVEVTKFVARRRRFVLSV
jgi:Ca2+-transporting ATPase